MNKLDRKKFEKLLLAERRKLVDSVRTLEEASRQESRHEAADDLQGFAETGTDSMTIQTALTIAGAESDQLAEIDDALRRIQDGTYGICEGSGKPIPKARLEVYPAARYCVEYQEMLEREGRT